MYQVVLAYQSLFAFKKVYDRFFWHLTILQAVFFFHFSFELSEKFLMKYLRQLKGCKG